MIAVAGKRVHDMEPDLLFAAVLPPLLMSSLFYSAWKEFQQEIGAGVSLEPCRDKGIAASRFRDEEETAYITGEWNCSATVLAISSSRCCLLRITCIVSMPAKMMRAQEIPEARTIHGDVTLLSVIAGIADARIMWLPLTGTCLSHARGRNTGSPRRMGMPDRTQHDAM